jgi:hypothetical protein
MIAMLWHIPTTARLCTPILRAVLGKSSVPFAGAPRELHADGVTTIEDGEIDQVQRSWTGKIYEAIE